MSTTRTIEIDSTEDHFIVSLHEHPSFTIKRFQENLAFVENWKPYEALELLRQNIDLSQVSLSWLQQFREDLEPQP